MNNDRYIKVEGRADLVRDRHTNAILNINKGDIEQAKSIRTQQLKDRQELEQLKTDVSEIKSLLLKLLEK